MIRPDVKADAVVHRHNIEAVMLTGDNEETAQAVARELHIDYVYADLLPEDKVGTAGRIYRKSDGIRKAGLCRRRDQRCSVLPEQMIGIAMGGLGADAALEAADVILMEDETF